MNYENFKENFIDDVKAGLYERGYEDVRIQVNDVKKFNDGYEAITVTPAGQNIGVNLNAQAFFEAYEKGRDYSEVVEKAVDTAAQGLANTPVVDVDALTDYEQMKDKLVMEVVATETNAELLATVPHKEMEDMSVVYRFVLGSDDDSRATILVTNNIIENMGVTPEQLHKDAMENSPALKPVIIKGMSEVLAEMMDVGLDDLADMGMPMDPGDEQMYVATVPDKIHGAGVLAYQDFMDQAAERCGGDAAKIIFLKPSQTQ